MMLNRVRLRGLLKMNVFVALLFSFFAHAQQPYIPFQHLSSKDGLSHNQILSMMQDRNGIMWIGTLEGLNRFDGYGFTVFSHNKKDSTSISDDFVSAIVEDQYGKLWIGTSEGLNRFDKATNTFTSYLHDEKNKSSLGAGLINSIIKDQVGNLWIGFATGYVDQFNISTGEFTHFKIRENLIDATSLLLDNESNVWVGTQQGIVVIDKAHQIIRQFQYNHADPTSLSNNNVNDIFQDHNGVIWIATENGLNQYDENKQNFIRYKHNDQDANSLSIDAIKCLEEDREGRLWIGTINGGLNVWDHDKNRIYHFDEKESGNRGLQDNSIYSLFRDRHNNMWVGTNSSGISFYDVYQKPFVIYQNIPGSSSSLTNNKVNAIAQQPDKGFWIATDGGGLNFFDEEQNLFKAYRHEAGNPSSLPGDFLVDVAWDEKEACLWIATWGAGLSRFDPVTGKFKNFRHVEGDSASLASDNLWRLYLDESGKIYIGTVGRGLSVLDPKTSRFTSYDTSDGIAEENVVSMLHDSKGFLWLGSWGNGPTRIDLSTNTPVALPKGITIKSDEFIGEDSLGRIWITGNPGIQWYDSRNNTSFAISPRDGLPQSNINGMLDDNHGNFWLSTNKGIVQFNLDKKQFNSFTMEDGLPTNQFGSRLLKSAEGKMYFGSVNGLVVFHPDSISRDPTPPELVITDLKIFNKSIYADGIDNVLKQSISETKEIWLPFNYNFITLNFIALNNSILPGNQYAYWLENLNEDWVYIEHQRSATFTNLDPGNYVFKVKASNNDGLWSEQYTKLIIHVLPPWWATYWFRIIAICFVIALAVGFYKYRLRNIKNQNTKLSMLVAERTRKLEALNAAVVVQNKVLQERQDEIETQNEELKSSKEEISAQWDVVMDQNLKLEEARTTIERQNEETKRRNDNLEAEVQIRTKELLEYNKQLEQFAFISAHNLRAPVARIMGLGNVLAINIKKEDEHAVIYQSMVATAQELDRVVRDLNTILEIRKNNSAFISEISFAEELIRVKLYIEKEISETGSKIIADFSQASSIRSVKPYVESILHNLLSNAIKYRHPDRLPEIKISTQPLGEYVCLMVCDNGLGIDTELFKDKIFKLYQRFHNHVEGKGLGLYLIKSQIEALGGRIELESNLNSGTCFRVYFKKN